MKTQYEERVNQEEDFLLTVCGQIVHDINNWHNINDIKHYWIIKKLIIEKDTKKLLLYNLKSDDKKRMI